VEPTADRMVCYSFPQRQWAPILGGRHAAQQTQAEEFMLATARPNQDHSTASRQLGFAAMESLSTIMRWHRGETIYDQGDQPEYWYRVTSGLARKCALTPEGRRRIIEFSLPGDFFGFSARDAHACAVEAVIEGTTVTRYPRRQLEKLADADPQLRRLIRDAAFQGIARLQARIVILGPTTAREKVFCFLADMVERLPHETTAAVVLPMSRYDIADYLAISVETVSRSLTRLRHSGAILLLDGRRVRILNEQQLSG
jgi:CRP/FNR family nitrogen fixation transcriptional regulator